LESRIRAFAISSEQLSQLKSKIDLDGYISGLQNLQKLSAAIFEAVNKNDKAALSPLLEKRNQARMEAAKVLNGMLKVMSTITELRNQDQQVRFFFFFFLFFFFLSFIFFFYFSC
jgi:hypothetical protein